MGRATVAAKKPATKKPTAGQRVLASLDSLGDLDAAADAALAGAAPAGAAFRVIALPAAGSLPAAADVAAIRAGVGLSQAKFAALIGVAVETVRAWEQGRNPLSGIAARFLAAVRDDPEYWRKRAAAG